MFKERKVKKTICTTCKAIGCHEMHRYSFVRASLPCKSSRIPKHGWILPQHSFATADTRWSVPSFPPYLARIWIMGVHDKMRSWVVSLQTESPRLFLLEIPRLKWHFHHGSLNENPMQFKMEFLKPISFRFQGRNNPCPPLFYKLIGIRPYWPLKGWSVLDQCIPNWLEVWLGILKRQISSVLTAESSTHNF